MHEEIKRAILDSIRAHERIILTRHLRPDGDAVGATMGLCRLLRRAFPDKRIWLANDDYAAALAFLGPEGEPPDAAQYDGALVIALDTGNAERLSNRHFRRAQKLIVIDHHIETHPYGDLAWVEPERSSTCEMVVDLCASFPDVLRLDRESATCLYTGMVTDSGRFRFDSVSGDTLRLAALLLDEGIDTEALYAHLYLNSREELRFHAHALRRMKVTPHGVAHLYVSRAAQRALRLTSEQAYTAVSFLDSLRGSIIWIAFIENGDGTIRVRLRSRFVTINELAERYGGGGHACASGATVRSRREMRALIADADRLIADYKRTHSGWQ